MAAVVLSVKYPVILKDPLLTESQNTVFFFCETLRSQALPSL